MALRERLKLYPSSQIRMRLSSRLVIIADIAVFHSSEPKEVPDALPLIAIEIQSPGDRLSEVRAKLEEYRQWGVPHVWLVDPYSRVLYTFNERFQEVDTLAIPELDIEVRPTDIFESL